MYHVMLINDGNINLTLPIVVGNGVLDTVPEATDNASISILKQSTTYQLNIIESCYNENFDINNPPNLTGNE